MNKFTRTFIKAIKSPSFISMMGTGLRIGGGLITLPLALRTIPHAQMGLYYTFLAIGSIAILLDFGFAPAITRNASYAMGGATRFNAKGLPQLGSDSQPNFALLAQLKYAVQKWYWMLAVFLAIGLFAIGSHFISLQIEKANLPSDLIYCWFVFALTTVYGFATIYWHDLLIGIGLVGKAANNSLISQLIGFLLTLLGLLLGFGLWSYAISGFISSAIGRSMSKRDFLKGTELPDIEPNWKTIRSVFSDLWPMAWRQGLVMIGAFFIQRWSTIVCSNNLGLEETSSYGLSLQVISIILGTAIIPLTMAWPEIGRLRVQQKVNEIRKIFFQRIYFGLGIAFVGIIACSIAGQWLLEMIGSKTQLLPAHLFVILGIIYWLEIHHSSYAALVLTENENPFLIPALASGLAIFAFSGWSAREWGIGGLILTQGAVQLAWNNWWTVKRGLRGIRKITSGPAAI